MGKPAVKILDDKWTAVTRDGSLSAHFEHTVAVTDAGPEVLTCLGAEPDASVTVGMGSAATVSEPAALPRG